MSPYKKGRIDWAKWAPTTKWWTATITSAGTIWLMVWVGDGINTVEEKTLAVGLVVSRLTAYATRNKDSRTDA